MKTGVKVVLVVLGVLAAITALGVATSGFSFLQRLILAEPRGFVEEVEQTTRGAYRIQEYERFYVLMERLDATDTKLAALPSTGLNTREKTACVGLLAVRSNIVSEYNAASRAVRTKGNWRASDLPSTLSQENPRKC